MVLPFNKCMMLIVAWVGGFFPAAILLAWPETMEQPPAGATRELADESAASDKQKLQGKWQVDSVTVDGKVHRREDKSRLWKPAFQNDLLVQGDALTHGPAHKGKFSLDESKDPKQITVQDAEGKLTFRGIYALDVSNLKVCIHANGKDSHRPEQFTTKKGVPLVIIAFKKVPAKP